MNQTPAPDPGDNELELLFTYDKLLTEHGTMSSQAQAFFNELRDHPELQDKLGATFDFRRLREAREDLLAKEAVRKQQQAQRRVRLVAAVGSALAMGCLAAIWAYAFRTDSAFLATKNDLKKAKDTLSQKSKQLGETAKNLRATDRTVQELREDVHDLVPALIVGLQTDKDKVKESTLSFLYSNGERLDPLLLKQLGPSLVNILDEQSGKPTRVSFLAKSTLERMSATAAKAGATDAIEALEVKLRQSTSQPTRDLLQTVQRIKQTWSNKAPTTIEVDGDECRVDGELTDKDPFDRIRTKSHCKVYLLRLCADTLYQIDLVGKDGVDPYLRLENDLFRELAFDDDGGTGLDARLLFRPPSDAAYRIIATTFPGNQTGPFGLVVQRIMDKGRPILSKTEELTSADKTGEVFNGVTAHRKSFPVSLSAGKEYLIEMNSSAFDAYLRVHDDKDELVAFDDDSGLGLDALIRFTPPASATYQVIATSFLPATGQFSLSVVELQLPEPLKER